MGDQKSINIRALRERLSWSQRQLAEHLGVDQATISRMENGQAPKGPTLRLLRTLSAEEQAEDAA